MEKPTELKSRETPKKFYIKPHLEVYGDLREITQGTGNPHQHRDGNTGTHSFTVPG